MTRAEYIAKYGVAPGGSSATPVASAQTPVPAPTPVSQTPASLPVTAPAAPVKMTRAEYTAKFGVAPALPAQQSSEGGGVGGFLKSIVSAPATLIARPFQAIQSAVQLAGTDFEGDSKKADDLNNQAMALTPQIRAMKAAGQDTSALEAQRQSLATQAQQITAKISGDANWKPSSGGIIAAAPENFGDVVKDVGRGAQTVAFGVGSPLAAGAAFGFGSSLEDQGLDALTTGSGITQTLASTLLGMGAGKALDLVGKPLLNAAGKVIGTITPKTLQDVAAKGSEAVANFMSHHEILPAAGKEFVAKIPAAAEKFDAGVSSLFKGGKGAVTGAIQSQYPGLTKDNVANHYEKIEVDRLMEPTKLSGSTFKKATEVATDAAKRGVDLRKLAADNKIYASDHIVDGKFSTAETANALRDEAMNGGKEILRPALAAADPSVQAIPISEVRNQMMAKLSKIPDARLSPDQKLKFAQNIAREYGDKSVTAASHPNGFNLTNLYDSKLQTSSGLYKGNTLQSISDSLTSQQKQLESQVFGDILKKNAPKELGLDNYFKAQEGKFVLANYLQELNAKKAPQSLFQRAVKKTAQLSGATAGANIGGPFGMFSGYQFGGIMADTFASASNPVKVAFLKSIGKSEPEIYAIMKQFTTDANIAKSMRQALPGAGETTRTSPTLFATPKGKITPIVQEARDIAAVESGKVKTSSSKGSAKNKRPLTDYYYEKEGEMPVIDAGKKAPKRKSNLPEIK